MILKNEKIEENKVRLEIEVSAERFAEGMDTAYEKVAPQVALPGFRKGKAPRKMIEKTYGVAVFYEEMMNAVIPVSFREALEETGAQIVSDPEYDIVTLEEGQPFVFSVEFFVKPEFELPQYKGIEAVEVKAQEVTDAQIDAILKRAAEENARQINVTDRAAQLGDVVTIDYAGYFGDEAFEGGTATNHDLELGSGSFIPGFEDQLVGVGLNEEKTVIVTFPEEYHHADYAGKEARFEVAVHKITAKEIPAIDDEFIKDISEFDTVDAYRADQMDKLTKAAAERAAAERENNVIEALIEATEINIPACMIEEEIDGRVQNF
ncbi:MAG: trigger factor, partial [Clostridia bacterium]|nr:trigger factor [Clostridia bacterium]